MEKRRFLDREISLLGFGCMRFPMKGDVIDYNETERLLLKGYERGVNYFDTAPIYHDGESETVIGKILSQVKRDSFYFADKLSAWTVTSLDGVKRLFESQLKKLKTDYIDFYLCHSMNEGFYHSYKKHGYIEYLHSLKEQGVIKNLGFSYHGTAEFLPTMCEAYPFDFAQLQVNYFDWEYQNAKRQYEILDEKNIPCVVMEPVRGGMLANLAASANAILKNKSSRSIASWAIRYVAGLPNVMTVLSGMSNMEQVEDNLSTMDSFLPLSSIEKEILEQALSEHKKSVSVPCTGCNYCNDCPKGIAIPKVFKDYNSYLIAKEDSSYIKIEAEKCIHCKTCMGHCPQGIDISKHMSDIKKL